MASRGDSEGAGVQLDDICAVNSGFETELVENVQEPAEAEAVPVR